VVHKYLKPAQRRYLKRFGESYTCGDPVPFHVTHADADNPDLLHGTVLGEPAVASRRCLAHPRCLPVYPVSLLAAEPALQWHLVDPTARPLRVSRNLNRSLEYFTPRGEAHPCPGLFLLALDALARRFSPLPAVVCLVTREFVRLHTHGGRLAVYPEQCHWDRDVRANSLFRIGQQIQAHVIVDLDAFTIDTSLLGLEGPEWRLVTGRYPVGGTVREAKFVVENRNGFVVDLPCPGLQVRGQVPFGELAEGNDPFSSYAGERERPLTLKVIRHDVQRRRLILSWRQALPPDLGRGDLLRAGQ